MTQANTFYADMADRNAVIWKLHDAGKTTAEIALIAGVAPTSRMTAEQIVSNITGADDGMGGN